jgi:ABC-2 type transport system ATP-binding protein
MATIEVRQLCKRFGDVAAVDELSFVARAGAVTGFLGPNGAGKTTTLRMLLGLVTPTAGTATVDGLTYRQLAEPARRVGAGARGDRIPSGPPRSRPPAGDRDRGRSTGYRVDEVLELVGLTDAGRRRVKGYSLGMRQRLGLAAALLGDPDVLILDEPANGLDPEGVHWLRTFLRGFADRGGTVLVSSHQLAEMAQTVDDVVIIAHGRLVTQSSLDDLAGRARAGVRVRTPHAETLRATLASAGIVAEVVAPDTVAAWETTTEAVGLAAAGAGAAIYEMTSERFDLEALFLDLTTSAGAIR